MWICRLMVVWVVLLTGSSIVLAQSFTEYLIPTPLSGPESITVGPDGNLWFTENNSNQIGRITPAGDITEFPIPLTPEGNPIGNHADHNYPVGITAGPDGNLWFTESATEGIGKITPGGAITQFSISVAGFAPGAPWPIDISAGPDGNLWFVSPIGQISTSGVISLFQSSTLPTAITAGSDSSFWLTFFGSAGPLVGRMTISGAITPCGIQQIPGSPNSYQSYGIAPDSDGNAWVTLTDWPNSPDAILRIAPDCTVTQFPIPTPQSYPYKITVGPDKALWFTESEGNKIGRLSRTGDIREFTIPTANSQPRGITVGPDGDLWFTEYIGNKIGRLSLKPPRVGVPSLGGPGGPPIPIPNELLPTVRFCILFPILCHGVPRPETGDPWILPLRSSHANGIKSIECKAHAPLCARLHDITGILLEHPGTPPSSFLSLSEERQPSHH